MQSVAVRLIVERENEIKAFVPEEYYRVTAEMAAPDGSTVKLELARRIPSYKDAIALLDALKDATFTVTDINVKPVKKSPAPPFTTSTLQQEASRKLGFTVSQTMLVAQKLYEAGHITYMRTDSLNLRRWPSALFRVKSARLWRAVSESAQVSYSQQGSAGGP